MKSGPPCFALKQCSLERNREVALLERLKALREVGKLDEMIALGKGWDGRRSGTRSRAITGKDFTCSKWRELRAIDTGLDEQLAKPGNVDDFVQRPTQASTTRSSASCWPERERWMQGQSQDGPGPQHDVAEGFGAEVN